ncbi:bifunctional diguanylate cyclase/phosphodiesterase [Neorhizobium alkalisoli]|uniref:Periplasmic sensor diguanylate cyclase/phosphodiesterase n=1 Tax=Neorhizobium alkalisoli TaxID=528178 RepID=A0A561QW62_9HYPH|nr:EAL domain-containing protein [Neorhizobium alkalisoli]TWF54607.1 periplasmic sensor diguanylate cyclase/phosphodiesterase [Neorhizobium alkalisoli]
MTRSILPIKSRMPLPKGIGLNYFLPAIIVIVAVAIGLIRAESEEREQYLASQRLRAAEQLAKVAASLETNIHGNVNLVHGLAAAVAANPNINQPQFAALSERIFTVPSQLRNVVAAPEMVVRFVYPEPGNQQALGLDYRTDTKQGPAALQAVQRRSLVITGPINLVQGGTGLIARYPIFSVSNGRFWGVVSAVIDLDRLYEDSNIGTERQTLDIAISQRPAPSDADIFLGQRRVFSEEPVKSRIELGYDTWYLAAVPKGGWQTSPPELAVFRIYAALIAFAIVAPLVWAGILMKQRQRNIVILQHREEELEAVGHRLALALEASEIGVWEYEPSTDTLVWDRRLREIFSAPSGQENFSYEDWRCAIHPDDLLEAERLLLRAMDDNLPYITQFRVLSANGDTRHVRAHGTTYTTSSGVLRIVGANWDVTEDVDLQTDLRDARSRAEEQNDELRATRRTLEHQSLHDALTGLPNRRFLDQFMDAARSHSPNHRLAFIHFDLDRFKEVNDTLGHAAGDEVLRQTTSRLLKLVDNDEFSARIGGDEFVVVTSGPAPEERAKTLARSIVRALVKPIIVDGHKCHVGCSAGVAIQTLGGEEPRQLLVNADVALYEAKKRGRNRMEVFSENLLQTAIFTKRTSDELLTAIESDQIVPFFQPQFDAQSLDIVGVEALARWQHPTRGLIGPDQFLDIAESLHRSADIDSIILQQALFQSTRWKALGLVVPHLSVNVSAQRLKDETLFEQIASRPIMPGTLSFELLESISFDGQDKSLRDTIWRLKEAGIDIEIDDFGTGHASIVSLLELGPKRLKIDRQLISPLDASGSQRRLVASIIEIGRSQGIEIVAEGVETAAHIEILRSLGCQILQGYAFAKPMSADDFVTFAGNWQSEHRPIALPAKAS